MGGDEETGNGVATTTTSSPSKRNLKDAGIGVNENDEEKSNAFYVALAGFIIVCIIVIGLSVGLKNQKVVEPASASDGGGSGGDATDGGSIAMDGFYFHRVANFPACMQIDPTCNDDTETVSEIVYASDDGNTLVYTDAETNSVGFVDITDFMNPMALGVVDVGGEPTSVGVVGDYAVVAVNTSPDFVNASGTVLVLEIASMEVVTTMDIGGQPDSVAVSPDKNFVAIAIENERDEDLNDGAIPQLPAGFLVVIDTSAEDPTAWTMKKVELTDLEGVAFASDPEPEYVSINENNICVVTLQENNAIALVDLAAGEVIGSFSTGTVDLEMIDTIEDERIDQTGSLTGVPREPDAVAWIGNDYIATADEGDFEGGSRGFTIFDMEGTVMYSSGNEMEHWAVRIGHYNEDRSENKGIEPEGIHFAQFEDQKFLFVLAERVGLMFVYEVSDVTAPVLKQILPTGAGPEGVFAIPSRDIVVVASEVDARGDTRAGLAIYHMKEGGNPYPTIISADREDGTPIPFSALSSLSAMDGMLYTVEDSYYKGSRIMQIDPSETPYLLKAETRIMDSDGVLRDALSEAEAALLLNDDGTVNLDPEGIEAVEGGFWLVSEGRGTVGDEARPVETPNLLLWVTTEGTIGQVVMLPQAVNDIQVRFGFEGVAVDGDYILVAFQREWGGEAHPRLGVYNTVTKTWKFVFYMLDAPESQAGGWVGLSDLASLGDGAFLVLERDNQMGPDAAIKKIYQIDLGDYSALRDGSIIDDKILVHDVLPDLEKTGVLIPEKLEGLTVWDGHVWINNDNDGVTDVPGSQFLINLGTILEGMDFHRDQYFGRVGHYTVCKQISDTCNDDTETVSEIVYANDAGDILAYTDAATGNLGFVDISDYKNPVGMGVVATGGEPTSVAFVGSYVVAAVNTSPDFVNPSGSLLVISMEDKSIVRTFDLGGQPDSVAVSPDKTYIAIAIENERDEDLNDGLIPQLPAGYLSVIDSSASDPADWVLSQVELTDLDGVLYATDPEAEYVAINADNVCAVTLQENNAIVIVDLPTGQVVSSFSAGSVDLTMVDTVEDSEISQTGSLSGVVREPDAITWIGTKYVATADEGDLDGGSRGFTIFDASTGSVVYTSGSDIEHWSAKVGHYNEDRSENKGAEPEGILYSEFGEQKLLFILTERVGLMFVYEVSDVTAPTLMQILPTGGAGPEGVFAIPSRDLVVVANEVDERDNKLRAAISIYAKSFREPAYPVLIGGDRADGTPIPFSALSGLSMPVGDMIYSVEDSYYKSSRIFGIDMSSWPFVVAEEMELTDPNGLLDGTLGVNSTFSFLNEDSTVNLDPEGIEVIMMFDETTNTTKISGFWIVSEGSGTIGDEARPFETPNLLVLCDDTGAVTSVVTLPEEVANLQVRFGFEGVTTMGEDGSTVVVAFQREWTGEDHPRLGIYNTISESWKFVYYPLDAPTSQYGGWVGLSDITYAGDGKFLILERDDQGGLDASIKRIYEIELGADFDSIVDGSVLESKTLVKDLMEGDYLAGRVNGPVMEKLEGLTIYNGNMYVNNDNDGGETIGEQWLLNVGSM